MPRRSLLALTLALAVALGCARLGTWQLERHEQRREYNARVAAQRAAGPIDLAAAQEADEAPARYRRAHAAGVFDFDRELILANRTRSGAPGVHLLTPLLLADGRAVLVNRGWVYSADATHIDRARWRERDSVQVTGFVDELPEASRPGRGQLAPGVWHQASRADVQGALPYPIVGYLVAAEVSPPPAEAPARVGTPAIEQGPHLSYAFQWFAFGTIALIGGGVLAFQDILRRR